ncbi:hypothetical protein Tco_1277964 [Tanacetum coccineum]
MDMELGNSGSDLHSMPSDDLASLTGFETANSDDEESVSFTNEHSAGNLNATSDADVALPNASAGVSALSDPLVSEDLKSSVPSLVSNALKETLLGLFADALKVSLPSLIQESVQQTVQQSMGEQTLLFHAQVNQTLATQLDNMIYKPMNKQLHAFNTMESLRFVILQSELGKVIHSKIGRRVKEKGEQESDYADVKGEHSIAQEFTKEDQVPPTPKTTIVLHESVNKNSEEDISKENDSKEKPPSKKLKVVIPTPVFPTLTPLSSIILEHLLNPGKMYVKQFTDQLFSTNSSSFPSSPPKEPTPPRDLGKGKRVATEEPMKQLIPFLEEGGSEPKMPNLKSFVLPEAKLTNEDILAQAKEMKRLADLKAKNEKSEQSLKKWLNPATVMAQNHKWAEHEEKKAKLLREYNKYCQLP